MALGLNYSSTGGEDILPIVKFDARAGRIIRIDRVDNQTEEVDITKNFAAVFDLENIEVGSISFAAGRGPLFDMVPVGQPVPAPAGEDFKSGFRFMVKLSAACGGDQNAPREMASTAKAFQEGLDKLHDDYLTGLKENPGKLPVVILEDTKVKKTEGKTQTSSNYMPVFKIQKWVARPSDLVPVPRGRLNASKSAPSSSPASTGSTRAAAPAPQTTSDAEDDFG